MGNLFFKLAAHVSIPVRLRERKDEYYRRQAPATPRVPAEVAVRAVPFAALLG
jgi:hypothetical protein